jgi:hypothetical protein
MTATQLWQRYRRHLCRVPTIGLSLDVSRMRFDAFSDRMGTALATAGGPQDVESVSLILEHLAANGPTFHRTRGTGP